MQVIDCGSSCIPVTVKADFATVYYRNSIGDTWATDKADGTTRKLSTGNPGNPQVWSPLDLDVQSKVAYWSWRDGTNATLQGIFSARADGTGWTPVDSGSDPYWYGPRVDDKYIFYFHAGALYRRLKP